MSTSKPEAFWRIGDILWEDIKSDRRYTLPHSIKRVITRWMRECDQINMEGGSLPARENMINLMTALDLENPAHNKKFRAKVKEEVASYVRNTGVKFRGVQYQEDIASGHLGQRNGWTTIGMGIYGRRRKSVTID